MLTVLAFIVTIVVIVAFHEWGHFQPICLPLGSNLKRDYVGTLPVALGWGTTYYGGEEVAKLRSVPLPVWTNGDCDDAYFQPITGMIRA